MAADGGTSGLDVVLLTEDRYERPVPDSDYVRQLLHEEALLLAALAGIGLRAERVSWSNASFDWSRTRAALFRSTWDYFHRFAEFCAWLDRVEPLTRLLNPAPLVRWNADKRYLLDVARAGVATVPTRYLPAGTTDSLADLLNELRWSEAVLKPAVSGTARETYRVDAVSAAGLEPRFRRLLASESLLLQPFRREIVGDGELSLVVLGSRFSHAVRKVARAGDFRVQDDHGGTVHPHVATADEILFAEAAVAAAPVPPLYARVDCIRAPEGDLLLMELELIEPELFFRFRPESAAELARLVAREIGPRPP